MSVDVVLTAKMSQEDKQVSTKNLEIHLIILLGIVVNVLVLFAISDLYFPSRIDDGVRLVEPPADVPPAKRLVLFLADGLGYEAAFESGRHKPIFLSILKHRRGSWGVARSRFPTVARSGHTAILTGTHENPITAILKDWTATPVNADSLINQTKHTWFWGNKKILSQFNPQNWAHVHTTNNGNFFRTNQWIVRSIKNFLSKNKHRISLKKSVFNIKGTLYLIHLPLSNPYGHITNLDKDIESISSYFTQAFADDSTAFIVTSAYGLTDWGSHGGDSGSETRTPFIAWGSGIRRNVKPIDIDLIDIAPLLACLIGVSIPANSLGVVPLDYLDLPQEHFVSEQATNAIQLSNVFAANIKWIKKHSMNFNPYKDLDLDALARHFAHLKYLNFQGNYLTFIQECGQLINDLLEGIGYYQNYHNSYLISSVLIGYFLWIMYLASRLSCKEVDTKYLSRPLDLLILIPIYLSYIQSWPVSYYVYSCFPFVMFDIAFPYLQDFACMLFYFLRTKKFSYIIPIQIFVLSTRCRYVASLSVMLMVATVYGATISSKGKVLWVSSCAALSIYSAIPRLRPTIFTISFIMHGVTIWVYLFLKWFKKLQVESDHPEIKTNHAIFALQRGSFILATAYRIFIYFGGTSRVLVSWLLSLVPLLSIPFTYNAPLIKIAAVLFGTSPFYLLASSSDELVFLMVYVVALFYWWAIETKSSQDLDGLGIFSFDKYEDVAEVQTNADRKSLIHVVFLFAGFYGAGNIFDVNSYNPVWVHRFTSNSLLSAFLIGFKISIPFLICFVISRAIGEAVRQNSFQLMCPLLLIINVVTFEMLLLFVFSTYSWLDIRLPHLVTMTGFSLMISISFMLVNVISAFSFPVFLKKILLLNKAS